MKAKTVPAGNLNDPQNTRRGLDRDNGAGGISEDILHKITAVSKGLGHCGSGAVKVAERVCFEHLRGAGGCALGALGRRRLCAGIFPAASACEMEVGHPLPVFPTRLNDAPILSMAAARAPAWRSLARANWR